MSATPRDDRSPADHQLWLVAIGDSYYASHPLPSAGEVELGRGEEADICIDAPSVSRRHARLLIAAGGIAIEDLDSANGTRVRGLQVAAGARAPIHPGELVELGSVSILLQRRAATGPRPARIWRHALFADRLAEECELAVAADKVFAVIVVPAPEQPEMVRGLLLSALASHGEVLLGEADQAGAHVFEVLILSASRHPVDEVVGQIQRELGAVGIEPRLGIALFPGDGGDGEALLGAARRAMEAGDDPRRPLVQSRAMVQLVRLIERVAAGNLSVLLLGETGVGKEVLAERVHQLSPRRGGRFVRVNCSALSQSLLESELFGHEKGAFTGAVAAKPGLLEAASGGTLFLDEIGEISEAIQVKLLRVLEDHALRRVGGLEDRLVDLRFVAATNRDLEAEIARGRFRKDLYYRLAGIALHVPPLRERGEEILPLAQRFLAGTTARLSEATRERLLAYSWPGNIRELRNVMERAALLCGDGEIRPEHLPEGLAAPPPPAAPAPADEVPAYAALYSDEEQKRRIVDALDRCRGNQTQAAALLGISRRTLVNRLNRYRLPRPRKKR